MVDIIIMASIFVEYCGSWGYGGTARALQQALASSIGVKVDCKSAKGQTGKIEASWIAGTNSKAFIYIRKGYLEWRKGPDYDVDRQDSGYDEGKQTMRGKMRRILNESPASNREESRAWRTDDP